MSINRLVSVIIPTYKRSELINLTVESVLNQTYSHLEIIVVDDNGIGTDEQIKTYESLEKYISDEQIIYLPHEVNKNGSAARNTGITNSKGDYICFLDDDDQFAVSKIMKQVELLEELSPDWGACYCGHARIFPDGYKEIYITTEKGNLFSRILTEKVNVCSGSTLMIRRSAIDKIGLFDESFKRYQDYEFLLRVAEIYKIAVVNKPLVEIYVYDGANKPKTAIETEQIRFHYLDVMKEKINQLPKKERKKVYYTNYVNISKRFIAEKNYKKAIFYILKTDKPIAASNQIFLDSLIYLKKKLQRSIDKRKLRIGE